jgi:YgiT-type zinc finger domain-containing protein
MSTPSDAKSGDCPTCGGELELAREVVRPVREGNDVALVTVRADVCTQCGELLLHPGETDKLVRAKQALRAGKTGPVVGHVYDLRAS